MARTTRPVTSDYDYNVVMEKMFTADGKETGWNCTRRLDTGNDDRRRARRAHDNIRYESRARHKPQRHAHKLGRRR